MAIQRHREGEEARQVPRLGIDGAFRLPCHLGVEILLGEGHETALPVTCYHRHNMMLKIMRWDEGAIEPRVSSGCRANLGCLGATEHKTGLRKALDPKVPNHIPF